MKINVTKMAKFADSTTGRLAATYLALIMLMSLGFSVVIYNVSDHQLHRQATSSSSVDDSSGIFDQNNIAFRQAVRSFLSDRASEARGELLWNLILLNVSVGLVGAGVSYYLARRTLAPIEAAMASKDQFISDASHELRTPLTALQTTNEVALRKPELSLKEAKELIAENIQETKRLKYLTDGLLGLLKEAQTNTLDRTEVSLQDIVSETMNQIVIYAQDKDITVEDVVPNIKIYSNPHILTQILTILVDNAIKYSPSKSTVTIGVKQAKKSVVISVRDEGIGIKATDLPHIFDRFYQADNSRSQASTQGYGLGLAIAKKLVSSIGGEIFAKSVIAKGSTFFVKLPIK